MPTYQNGKPLWCMRPLVAAFFWWGLSQIHPSRIPWHKTGVDTAWEVGQYPAPSQVRARHPLACSLRNSLSASHLCHHLDTTTFHLQRRAWRPLVDVRSHASQNPWEPKHTKVSKVRITNQRRGFFALRVMAHCYYGRLLRHQCWMEGKRSSKVEQNYNCMYVHVYLN